MSRKRFAIALVLLAALCIACFSLARATFAEHFDITLTVTSPGGSGTASWDTSPPEMGVNPRPVVPARPGQEVRVRWSMRSEFPHGVMRGVTVHFYVLPEQEVGQKTRPPATTPHQVDTAFRMDYLPDYAAQGELRFRAGKPGAYLVFLTSEGTEKGHGHEHFAAVDLKVEE